MLQEEGTCQSFSGSPVLHKATIRVSHPIHLPPPCIGKMGSGRGYLKSVVTFCLNLEPVILSSRASSLSSNLSKLYLLGCKVHLKQFFPLSFKWLVKNIPISPLIIQATKVNRPNMHANPSSNIQDFIVCKYLALLEESITDLQSPASYSYTSSNNNKRR